MKILINTPNWRKPELGGIANHFYGLKPYWTENVRYNIVGSRNRPGRGVYWLPWDLLKTIVRLIAFSPDAVMVNTSLGGNALKRDAIFLRISTWMGKKVIVHFHGFNPEYAKVIDKRWFLTLFGKAQGFIVLSESIKNQLLEWGIGAPICLSTTKVDDRLIYDYNINNKTGSIHNILYLGRIEREKGIYISLDVFCLLQVNHPELCFTVVGSGSELAQAKKYAEDRHIRNIVFTGALNGTALRKSFEQGDLYIFTSFHEGMPTSVLEAMCFGMPIVTRPVGGIVDFFENGIMGEMIDSFEPADFADSIEAIMNNKEAALKMMMYNYEYGRSHFLASHVAKQLEITIKELC